MTALPVQSKEKLDAMLAGYVHHGRIVKMSERQKQGGEPFWLITVRMKRWIEKEVWTGTEGRIGGEYKTGEWTFVSWHPIQNAAPDRILHFDLTGNVWHDREEIGEAEVDWTTKLKPVKAAVAAVKQWLFKPFLAEGEPKAAVYVLSVDFKMKDTERK